MDWGPNNSVAAVTPSRNPCALNVATRSVGISG